MAGAYTGDTGDQLAWQRVREVRQRRVGGQQGDPDYKSSQDRDGDGIACEG
ncbi:excalibur calcium-binding domain-containing protein [Mycolicibacterium mucogenicum]|uniref:excalibur calcium-binding domain-containing protein n=1 Tax=Mycolicibacterium mucogenicum TaxID=56689 RepID=UPI001F33BB0F|nr:excalibur calcium-binding domain-containing protein [Mycolicibacterium mucogenicum]MCX8557871.1 excalibur calcium-binding domain-containing protein [Mycolicibacterium mucogenicum]